MMLRRVVLIGMLAALAAPATGHAQEPVSYEPTATSLARHRIPAWWQDGKFGVFIHWGVYSVPAYAPPGASPFELSPNCSAYAEWYWFVQQVPACTTWRHHLQTYGPDLVYDDFIPRFRAERFDPDAWVRLFARAGARYFVLTAKHHDGFSLWCTGTTRRNACEMGPRRDLVGALIAAARRDGDRVRPGLYYSIPEWYNPAPRPASATDGTGVNAPLFASVFPPRNAYTQVPVPYTGYTTIADYAAGQVRPQLRELIDRYHPSVLWCDIGGDEDYFRSNETIAHYFNQARRTTPEGVVVDDRCGDPTTHRDYKTSEYKTTYPRPPFEATRGMGSSFGYNSQESDGSYLTGEQLIATLVSTVAHGGNLLLNVGPRADGTIPEPMADRLRAIGDWLAINGEAIYGSRPWTRPEAEDLRFTVGPAGFLYVTMLSWPGRELTIDAPLTLGRGARVALLGSDERPLPIRRAGSGHVVTLPSADRDVATRSRGAYTLRIGPRLRPARLSARTDHSQTRVAGALTLPAGVTPAMGCRGTVEITAMGRRRSRTLGRTRLLPSCRYRLTIARAGGATRKVARFTGNPVLRPLASPVPQPASSGPRSRFP